MSKKLILPKHMLEFFEKRAKSAGYDRYYMSNLKLLYAPEDEGKCVVEMNVEPNFVNVGQVLHGGLIASLIDSVSTGALYNTLVRKTGVSVNMNVSYIKAAKLGETVIIDSKVLNVGKKLAFLDANIYLKDKNKFENTIEFYENLNKLKLIASAAHTKYIGE